MRETENKLKEIDDILTRGVFNFTDPDGKFKNKLISKVKGEYNQDIIIKLGADPTRPDLHLGHAVVLRKLRKLQDLGCKVVFILGDFTTLLGDPTGKSKTRSKIQKKEEEKNTSEQVSATFDILEANEEKVESFAPEIPTSIEIAKNMQTYTDQVGKILLTNKESFSWIKNSDWFMGITDMNYGPEAKASIDISVNQNGEKKQLSLAIPPNSMVGKTILFEKTRMQTSVLGKNKIAGTTLRGLLWTLQHVTHARLIERSMFRERIDSGEELYMHEMLYPVIQGIDSLSIAQIYGSCDLEIGGSDQTFNILMGRDIMKINNIEPQSVLTFKVLEGLDGKEKMSKSLDNYIAIMDSAEEMYGKTMSIPDSSIISYFELCTYTSLEDIEEIKKELENNSKNPKDIKMRLAGEIVAMYHGEGARVIAEQDFITKFQKKEIPDEVLEVNASAEDSLMDVFKKAVIVESNTEFRRLVEEGAITFLTGDNLKIGDATTKAQEGVYKIGKKRFIKIVFK
jgi:tyrosyl-tRNA synthetase